MAKRVIQLYDKYKSTTKVYPLIIGECLTDDAKLAIKGIADKEIEDNVPDIIANVELAGTEAELTSLQIGDTKYKIGGGKQLYKHIIKLDLGLLGTFIEIINDNDTAFTITTLKSYLHNNGFIDQQNLYPTVSGHYRDTSNNTDYSCLGVFELENTLQCSAVQNGVNSTTYKKITTLVNDKVLAL